MDFYLDEKFFSKNFRLLETEQHSVRSTLEFLFTLSISFGENHTTLNIGTRKLALGKKPVALDIHLNMGSWPKLSIQNMVVPNPPAPSLSPDAIA